MNKLTNLTRAVALSLILASFASCTDKAKEAEAREEEKVGDVYDAEQQGVDIENRDNQFPVSRNNNVEGEGQETGAPSDTIDGDGDKAMKQQPAQQQP